jgi:predicted O-methyltransferase YrrM
MSLRSVKKAVLNPLKTARLVNRRYLRLGVASKDPEVNALRGWVYGALQRRPLAELFPGIEKASYTVVNGFTRTDNMSVTLFELNALLAMARHIDARRVMEIGTFDGGTAVNLAANLPDGGVVVTADLPPSFKRFELAASSFHDNQSDHALVGRQFRGTSHEAKITQLLEDSAKIDYAKLGGPFDLFFIDGCHDYLYVKHDTEQALRHVRPKGLVVWHDYGMIEDVSRYVDEVARDREVNVIRGTRLAVTVV